MNYDFYKNITDNIFINKDKIKSLIGNNHNLSSGISKENILKNTIKNHLPSNFDVSSGFVIGNNCQTTQIDIIIYDKSFPILHKENENIFITADAVIGIVEVKTSITDYSQLKTTIEKLSDNSEVINKNKNNWEHPLTGYMHLKHISNFKSVNFNKCFVGLFSFDIKLKEIDLDKVLNILLECVDYKTYRIVNHISLGKFYFVKFWDLFEIVKGTDFHLVNPYIHDAVKIAQHNKWSFYDFHMMNLNHELDSKTGKRLSNKIDKGIGPAFFITNLLSYTNPNSFINNFGIWFPIGKGGSRSISGYLGRNISVFIDNNDIENLLEILENGIHPNSLINSHYTIFMYAIEQKKIEIIKLLLRYGADIDLKLKRNKSALLLAVLENDIQFCEELLKIGADPNTSTTGNVTALHYATNSCYFDIIKVLIKYKANIKAKTALGNTVLHFAASKNNMEIIEYLIKQNAEIDAINNDNKFFYDHLTDENKNMIMKNLHNIE